MKDLIEQVNALPGFKISGSHFRIGRKIHVNDFYYARTFFQNNFFASRFAFVLCSQIPGKLSEEEIIAIKEKGLTLVGYGMYSELLLSLLERFLKKHPVFQNAEINHNLITDVDSDSLVKKDAILHTVIIVVPIASTFSTGLKIEKALERKEDVRIEVNKIPRTKRKIIIKTHFNILHIADTKENPDLDVKEEFGWLNQDTQNRKVTVEAFYAETAVSRIQSYFIRLPTKWTQIDSCKACFPADHGLPLNKEQPLYETDKFAVTPTIIFNYPRARKISKNQLERTYELQPAMVQYGHHQRNQGHFLYSVETEEFLSTNRDKIKKWLTELREEEWFDDCFPRSAHILIVSSAHYSNTGFIHLVNEQLFSSSANIIHYDPANDYLQNFQMIYGREIGNADKIIFVDDSLKTGTEFMKIADFIKQTAQRIKPDQGICMALFLVNKSQEFNYARVVDRLVPPRCVDAFANLHLATSLSPDRESPFDLEEKRYQRLADESLLDSLKQHFYLQKRKLNTSLATTSNNQRNRHLLMLLNTHRLYDFFGRDLHKGQKLDSLESLIDGLNLLPNSPLSNLPGPLDLEQRRSVLKIMTLSPFIQYMPIRQLAFKWIHNLLPSHIKTVLSEIENKKLTYASFSYLKFLLRRATQLKSNLVVCNYVFELLQKLYDKNGLLALAENHIGGLFVERESNESTNILDFTVFFASQVKELLLQNESLSTRLEQILTKDFSTGTAAYMQLVRILRVESSGIINQFFQFLKKHQDWRKIYKADNNAINNSTEPIKNLLKKKDIISHHLFRQLRKFFAEQPYDHEPFVNYLWIQYFIQFDNRKPDVTLSDKTEKIIDRVKQLFVQSDSYNATNIGVFLIIKNSEQKYFLAYDKNSDKMPELDRYSWNNATDKLLESFVSGEFDKSNKYYKSIIELERDNESKKWIDMYATEETRKYVDNLSPTFVHTEKYNRLLLLRLSRRFGSESQQEEVQGVIGFYFKSKHKPPTDINRTRYLLLLKDALCSFIGTHHQNNEYREWLKAENNKRLAFLTGHGMDMLRHLVNADQYFKKLVINLQHLQMIVMTDQNTKALNAKSDIESVVKKFYQVDENTTISKGYLVELTNMCNKIFESPNIELKIDYKIETNTIENDFQFYFNKDLLNLICFELFVNAKKNRWHFLDGETIQVKQNNDLVTFERPLVKIEMNVADNLLLLNIQNLTVELEIDQKNDVDSLYKNIKKDDDISGTALIKTLIRDILKDEIAFTNEVICSSTRLSWFKAAMMFKSMKHE